MGNGNLRRRYIAENPRHKSRTYIFMDRIGQNLLRIRSGGHTCHGCAHDNPHALRISGKGSSQRFLCRHIGILGERIGLSN